MPQLIEWTDDFQAELSRIDQKTALRILRAIARLAYHQEGDVLATSSSCRAYIPPSIVCASANTAFAFAREAGAYLSLASAPAKALTDVGRMSRLLLSSICFNQGQPQ